MPGEQLLAGGQCALGADPAAAQARPLGRAQRDTALPGDPERGVAGALRGFSVVTASTRIEASSSGLRSGSRTETSSAAGS